MTSFVRSFGHAISAYVNVHHAPRRRHGKLKRATRARVHPIDRPRVIGISSNLHTRTRRVKRSQASSFRRCLRKLGHIRVVCLSSIRFLVPTTFLSVSVFIFFSFISSARTDRILLGRRIFLLRWPRHEYTKLLRETFSLIATASLSPCYIRGLPFSQGFCNLNIQTCLAPIFVSLVSIFIYRVLITDPFHSSLLPSTFFNFYILLLGLHFTFLFVASPSRFCSFLFKQKEERKGGEEEEKIAHSGATISGIGNEFNELASSHPTIPSAFLLFHRPSRDSPPFRLPFTPRREKTPRIVLGIRVESWPGEFERMKRHSSSPSFTLPSPYSLTRQSTISNESNNLRIIDWELEKN